jgi:8-oxo-dGTP pyrophosphatase MutT (NUDIX family)
VVKVVGVALLRQGAVGREVLAAQRTHPPETAGRWELPGGKCGQGEGIAQAAVRELGEELGVDVVVTGVLDGVVPIAPGLTLEVVTAEVVAGVPVPTEHAAVRWLTRDRLRSVDWLEPDRPFLDQVEAVLGASLE